jgi:hypothetical protein
MNRSWSRVGAAVFAVAALSGCGGSSDTTTGPSVSAAGTYTVTQWVTTGGSGQTNQLLAGSTFDLILGSNGTTFGHIHIAASASNPEVDADMTGTWTQQGMTVEISQAADTFVRDMPFTLTVNAADGWDLVGDKTFSGTQIKVTLHRVGV